MSQHDNTPFIGGDLNVHRMREMPETVFSKTERYNPTSLAIAKSLKDIFDEFQPMITGNLRKLHETDHETF